MGEPDKVPFDLIRSEEPVIKAMVEQTKRRPGRPKSDISGPKPFPEHMQQVIMCFLAFCGEERTARAEQTQAMLETSPDSYSLRQQLEQAKQELSLINWMMQRSTQKFRRIREVKGEMVFNYEGDE